MKEGEGSIMGTEDQHFNIDEQFWMNKEKFTIKSGIYTCDLRINVPDPYQPN